jgi:hypothetical protein
LKTSVYIPDDLWAQVQQSLPDTGASQLLQECLRSKIVQKPPAYAVVTEDLRLRSDVVAQESQAKLISAYQRGYALGLDVFAAIPTYELLSVLAMKDFDLNRFRLAIDEEEEYRPHGAEVFDFQNCLGPVLQEHELHDFLYELHNLPAVTKRGAADAMRYAWDAVSGEDIPTEARRGAGGFALAASTARRRSPPE